ncbi:hypothetical protein [Nostoc sp.]
MIRKLPSSFGALLYETLRVGIGGASRREGGLAVACGKPLRVYDIFLQLK